MSAAREVHVLAARGSYNRPVYGERERPQIVDMVTEVRPHGAPPILRGGPNLGLTRTCWWLSRIDRAACCIRRTRFALHEGHPTCNEHARARPRQSTSQILVRDVTSTRQDPRSPSHSPQ